MIDHDKPHDSSAFPGRPAGASPFPAKPNNASNNAVKTADASSNASEDVVQLRADFGRLSDSVAELVKAQAQTVAGTVREQVGKASDVITSNLADLGATATKMTSGAQASMQSATNDLETSIERNPLAAVMIAAGIGLVLGLVTGRS